MKKKSFVLICSLLLTAGCSQPEAEITEKIQIEKPTNPSASSSNENDSSNGNNNITNQNNSLQNQNNQPPNLIQIPENNNPLPPASNQPIFIQFKAHNFDQEGTGYIPPRLAYGGAWIYTKESHPSDITNEFNWDVIDVIHVQLNDPKYKGYTPEPIRIELVSGSLRITFDMRNYNINAFARRYIEIPRGSVPLNTPIYLYSTSGEQLY